MSEHEQIAEQQSKEVQMEELIPALLGGAKQGVDWVTGGIGGFFKYSWMGVQYATDDVKQLSGAALSKLQKKEEATAEA